MCKTSLKEKSCSWGLSYLNKVVAVGNTAVQKQGDIKVKLTFPKLDQQVVATCQFVIKIGAKEFKQWISFFPPGPFQSIEEELKDMNIGIWDGTKEKTLKHFCQSHKIAFEDVDSIKQFKGQLLIIAGIDFDGYSNLLDSIETLGKRNVKLLVIPPVTGELSVNSPQLNQILFAKQQFISHFSAKYDTMLWADQPFVNKSVKSTSFDNGRALKIVDKTDQFTYCEFRINQADVTICTWELLKFADQSPTALYLFKDLMLSKRKFL